MSLSLSGPLRPESRYLLDHYLHSTGKKASAHVGNQGKYTPFTDALMPVANESAMLFESILTFSCFHLAANNSSLSMVDTLEQHSVALQSLKYGITKYSKGDRVFGIQLFLSMLMLTCTEVCQSRAAIIVEGVPTDFDSQIANGGQSGSAFQHLSALRRLAPEVLGRISEAPSGAHSAFIFGRELYAYCLCVACICDPEAPDDPGLITEADSLFSEISASGYTGALFGCSDTLFCLIPQVSSHLTRARALREHGRCTALGSPAFAASNSDAASLELQIAITHTRVSLWEPNTDTDETFQYSGRILQLALTSMLVEAAYWVSLETPTETEEYIGHTSHVSSRQHLDAQVWILVAEAVSLLEKLPPEKSQIATTMCWSIVVIGSYATDQHHRDNIRDYFLTMEATFGFDNMKRSRLTLEYIWAHVQNFNEHRPMPIAQAMRHTGGLFILG
jgi:hypothetical protein